MHDGSAGPPVKAFGQSGFSLGLWSYTDNRGRERVDHFRPRIRIKYIDNKRSLIDFGGRRSPDKEDLIPEDSKSGDLQPGYIFRGHFLDLRTFAFALTDNAYSFEAACEAFGVEHGKHDPLPPVAVTDEYIDHVRRDVLATTELSFKLLEEFNHHPLALSATRAFSPASIGKGYLRAMRIKPILARQPGFPKQYLGHAQTAFLAGGPACIFARWSVRWSTTATPTTLRKSAFIHCGFRDYRHNFVFWEDRLGAAACSRL